MCAQNNKMNVKFIKNPHLASIGHSLKLKVMSRSVTANALSDKPDDEFELIEVACSQVLSKMV